MTVSELIEALRRWPDQQARVIFTYASEIDGDLVIAEVETLREPSSAVYRDGAGLLTDHREQQQVSAVELA